MDDTDIEIKTCWNCGNNGGDKTNRTEKNPCISCDVTWSFGVVDFVPEGKRVNWMPVKK